MLLAYRVIETYPQLALAVHCCPALLTCLVFACSTRVRGDTGGRESSYTYFEGARDCRLAGSSVERRGERFRLTIIDAAVAERRNLARERVGYLRRVTEPFHISSLFSNDPSRVLAVSKTRLSPLNRRSRQQCYHLTRSPCVSATK